MGFGISAVGIFLVWYLYINSKDKKSNKVKAIVILSTIALNFSIPYLLNYFKV